MPTLTTAAVMAITRRRADTMTPERMTAAGQTLIQAANVSSALASAGRAEMSTSATMTSGLVNASSRSSATGLRMSRIAIHHQAAGKAERRRPPSVRIQRETPFAAVSSRNQTNWYGAAPRMAGSTTGTRAPIGYTHGRSMPAQLLPCKASSAQWR